MSRLEFLSRPLVAFDPSNRKHRRYYAEYLEYGGWGKCPVRFIVTEDVGMDLPTMIKNRLVEYYISREFGTVTEIARQRSEELLKDADALYKKAGKMRKEADALKNPRRS